LEGKVIRELLELRVFNLKFLLGRGNRGKSEGDYWGKERFGLRLFLILKESLKGFGFSNLGLGHHWGGY